MNDGRSGWIYADIKVSAEDLGRVEATNRSFMQEYVVAAGLHRAISGGREDELSRCASVIGIVALRHSYFSKEDGSPLADWAVRHLSKDLESGVNEVLQYWNAALDAGDEDLDNIGRLSNATGQISYWRC